MRRASGCSTTSGAACSRRRRSSAARWARSGSSVTSRTAVAEALGSWPGTVVLVSHDPEFVDALSPDLALLLPDADVDYWSTDLLDLVPLA